VLILSGYVRPLLRIDAHDPQFVGHLLCVGNELAHWWIVRVKAVPVVKGSNFLGLAHTWQRSRRGDAGEAKRQSLTPVPILALEFFGGIIPSFSSLLGFFLTWESNTVSNPLTTSEAPISKRVVTCSQSMLLLSSAGQASASNFSKSKYCLRT